MWAWRRREWTNSPFVCTWSVGRRRMCLVRHWKLLALPVTSTWLSLLARMHSTCGCECIHSMFSGSTRCFHVLGLIGFRQEWGELLESHKVSVLELPLGRCCCLCAARTRMESMLKKLSAEPNSNSLVARRSSLAENGMYPAHLSRHFHNTQFSGCLTHAGILWKINSGSFAVYLQDMLLEPTKYLLASC